MPITYASGETAHEEAWSLSERINLFGDHTSKVMLRCAWADRFDVAQAALGTAQPQMGLSYLVCIDATISPAPKDAFNIDGQGCVYDEALIELSYGIPPGGASEQKTDPATGATVLVTESVEPTIEYLKCDPKGFRWTNQDGRPLKENEAPSRQMRGLNLVRSVQDLPSLHSSLLTLPGKTNNASYVSSLLGLTFTAGTLLFIPPSLRRTIKSDGTSVMSLVLKLGYKEQGWNKFWRQDKSGTNKYDEIYDVGAGAVYENFPQASFANWLY